MQRVGFCSKSILQPLRPRPPPLQPPQQQPQLATAVVVCEETTGEHAITLYHHSIIMLVHNYLPFSQLATATE